MKRYPAKTKIDMMQEEAFRRMTPQERLHRAGEFYSLVKKIVASQSGEKVYERVRRASDKSRIGS